jgi:hypothetical protein
LWMYFQLITITQSSYMKSMDEPTELEESRTKIDALVS